MLKQPASKYQSFKPVRLSDRTWPLPPVGGENTGLARPDAPMSAAV